MSAPSLDPAGSAFVSEGAGPPLVLIHGVGLDMAMWDAQAKALAGRHRVIRYDMLGHGASADPPGERKLADFVEQLRVLLDHLEVTAAAVVGFSMGGLVARAFALGHPERVRRLVVMSAVFERSPEQQAAVLARVAQAEEGGPAANLDAALERWFSPDFRAADPEAVERVRKTVLANDPEGYLKAYRVFATADGAASEDLAAIGCPTLVVTGVEDLGSTPAMAEAMAARIPGATCRVLPGRHMIPVERAEEVNEGLRDFLAEPARTEAVA